MRRSRSWALRMLIRLTVAVAAITGVAPAVKAGVPAITEVPTPSSRPSGIAAGPDGNLWFTEAGGNKIGRITPTGTITEFPLPTPFSQPCGITAGPDGNLWFTEQGGNRIGRITPTGTINEFPLPTPLSHPRGIAAGPDGNLWFTAGGNRIGRITPTGTVTEFPLPTADSGPEGITAGPDGNLWFTEQGGRIGRITLTGTLTEFPVPTGSGFGGSITAGPDGNLWFTASGKIGRITPTGTITEFPAPTPFSQPAGITAGPDGNLWFTEFLGNRIGRISFANALVSTGAGPGGGPHVELFSVDSASGTPTPLGHPLGFGFFAYDPGFTGGVQPTLVQADGDVFLVTGVGAGGGPHIKLFKITDLNQGTVVQLGLGFFAYDPGFTGGVRVAATTDGAGHLLIVSGAGPGGGPHVKVFQVTDLVTGAVVQLGGGFMAYDIGFTGGVHVAAKGGVPAITEFPLPTVNSGPGDITAGPDGNLWFTEGPGNRIGRITPTGTLTEFPLPTANSGPGGITAGPDGNLWFTEVNGNTIGRITPTGTITEFPLPTYSPPVGITAGPDGNLWFTEGNGNQIGRITPTGTITEFPLPTPSSQPVGITAGPDGNLWFTESFANQIGRITPTGTITEFPLPASSGPFDITAGPDGNLWFTEQGGLFGNQIGRITPTGTITEFPLPTPSSQPHGITAGPDGNLWFTEVGQNQIGRITPTGTITEFPLPTRFSRPHGITAGPDGNLWFTEGIGNQIGRISFATALVATGAGAGGGPHVKLFSVDSASGTPTPLGLGFFAYDPGFTGGVQPTLVQADGDVFLVTGVGAGGGPHIKLFKSTDLNQGTVVQIGLGFFAYDPGFTGGVRVAATTDGAGHLLIVTGAGPGGGPHVKVFQVTDLVTGAVVQLGSGFMAYNIGFTGGVNVGAE